MPTLLDGDCPWNGKSDWGSTWRYKWLLEMLDAAASILDASATLTTIITLNMGNTTYGSLENNVLWSMGLILLIISFTFIFVIRYLGSRRKIIMNSKTADRIATGVFIAIAIIIISLLVGVFYFILINGLNMFPALFNISLKQPGGRRRNS